ncbi:MAG: hypothetical protein H6684_09430 [Deltaproteobacteria bacterium]|nr:hypothetical protein [bacterium]MCB9488937.1 hypothetical protein [Deltaproteobacteria bacterium]
MRRERWWLMMLVAMMALGVMLGVACGDDDDDDDDAADDDSDDDDDDEGDELQGEACEHMTEGPFENAAAIDDPHLELDDVAFDHTSVNIALIELEDGNNGGYVAFTAEETGEFFFFLSEDVGFAVLDGDLSAVEIEESGSVSACDEVSVYHVADLDAGTYILEFSGADVTSVSLVHEMAGEHDHDHEE